MDLTTAKKAKELIEKIDTLKGVIEKYKEGSRAHFEVCRDYRRLTDESHYALIPRELNLDITSVIHQHIKKLENELEELN